MYQVRKLRNCPLCHSRLDVTAMHTPSVPSEAKGHVIQCRMQRYLSFAKLNICLGSLSPAHRELRHWVWTWHSEEPSLQLYKCKQQFSAYSTVLKLHRNVWLHLLPGSDGLFCFSGSLEDEVFRKAAPKELFCMDQDDWTQWIMPVEISLEFSFCTWLLGPVSLRPNLILWIVVKFIARWCNDYLLHRVTQCQEAFDWSVIRNHTKNEYTRIERIYFLHHDGLGQAITVSWLQRPACIYFWSKKSGCQWIFNAVSGQDNISWFAAHRLEQEQTKTEWLRSLVELQEFVEFACALQGCT